MFEVGFSEMLLIAVLALVVLGPEKLPRVAAQMGRWVGRARAMARQFREQLEEEASLEATARRPGATGSASTDYSSSHSTPPYGSTETTSPEATAAANTSGPSADATSPSTPPPEVVASAPAHDIDSNDTQHTDLSESPATETHTLRDASTVSAAAGQSHERGT